MVTTVVITVVPLGIAVARGWGVWDGVPPAHIEDALFYYSRMHEVIDGNFFFGNPAYIEHSKSVASSFSISEWMAALPLAVTHSWAVTIIWNNIFWPLLTVLLLYFFFRVLEFSKWGSALGAFFVLLQMILLFERPVIMQVPYAAFAALMLVGVRWLKEDTSKNSVWLVVVSAAAALVWVFLGGVAALMLGFVFVYFLWLRDWTRVRSLLKIGLFSMLLVLPLIVLQAPLLFDSSYHDMLMRFGLVASHIPSTDAWYYGRWLALLGVALLFGPHDYRKIFFGTLSLALFITFVSPLVTGNDVNNGSHAGRFVFPLLAAGIVFIFDYFFVSSPRPQIKEWQKCLVVFVLIASVIGVGINIKNRNIPHIPSQANIATPQAYAAPLAFIQAREPAPVVIFANADMSQYVPLVTNDYVLFTPYGGYYLVPSDEVHERYLASLYPATTSLAHMVANAGQYDLGAVTYEPQASERLAGLCTLTRGILAHGACGTDQTYHELKGDRYFQDLVSRYQKEIVPNIKIYLDKYHVAYVIRDTLKDAPLDPTVIGGTKVYDDGRFIVFAR